MKKHKMTKRLILALGIIGLSVTGGRADSVNEKEITMLILQFMWKTASITSPVHAIRNHRALLSSNRPI